MCRLAVTAITSCLLIFVSQVRAEAVSLETLMQQSIANNPEIAAAISARDEAYYEVRRSLWALFPSFRANSSQSNAQIDQTSASLVQPLWTGGDLSGRIARSEARLAEYEARLSNQAQDLFLQLTAAFAEASASQDAIAVAKLNLERHEALLERIKRRASAEASAKVDVKLAEARRQYAVTELLRLNADLQRYLDELERLSGMTIGEITADQVPRLPDQSLAALIEEVESVSPALAAYRALLEQARAEMKVAKALTKPKIFAGYERRFDEIFPGQAEEQFYVAFEYAPGAGFEAGTAQAAARARERTTLASMESARQDVVFQVKAAVNFIEVSHAQLGPAKALVDATRAVSDSYLRQFSVGHKSWLDVMNAQREAHQAQLFEITQRKNFLSGYYRLQVMRQAYAPLTTFAPPMTELELLRTEMPAR